MAFADVKVDAKYHKHIIGKGGSTINKIKSETDVTINIPDTDSGVTVIRIEGNKAGVDKASKELEGMVEKMENEKEKDLIITRINEIVKDLEDKVVTIDCKIEQTYHRTVMGAKGSKVQKITTDFNVQIKFPDKAVENGEAPPPVTNGERLDTLGLK